jgi:hypothetical protein
VFTEDSPGSARSTPAVFIAKIGALDTLFRLDENCPLDRIRAAYIGVATKLQAEAVALGGTISYLDPEEGRKIEARCDYIRPWELWKRQAMGK